MSVLWGGTSQRTTPPLCSCERPIPRVFRPDGPCCMECPRSNGTVHTVWCERREIAARAAL
jgi:hypothetical protein